MRGVGAVLMAAGSTDTLPDADEPDRLEFEYKVDPPMDIWLSPLLPGVMVMLELRTVFPGPEIEFDLSVTASLPSCVAVPSLSSWTK